MCDVIVVLVVVVVIFSEGLADLHVGPPTSCPASHWWSVEVLVVGIKQEYNLI